MKKQEEELLKKIEEMDNVGWEGYEGTDDEDANHYLKLNAKLQQLQEDKKIFEKMILELLADGKGEVRFEFVVKDILKNLEEKA